MERNHVSPKAKSLTFLDTPQHNGASSSGNGFGFPVSGPLDKDTHNPPTRRIKEEKTTEQNP